MKNNLRYIIMAGSLLLAIGFILLGCKTPAPSAESSKGSAQLWQENCMRCHNMRNPASYSDKEWEIAMHHMRVRAALTAEEHRRILEYLQASN